MLSRLVGGGMADVEVGWLELLATLVACFAQAVVHGTRPGPSVADCFGGERNRKRGRGRSSSCFDWKLENRYLLCS